MKQLLRKLFETAPEPMGHNGRMKALLEHTGDIFPDPWRRRNRAKRRRA